MGRRSAAQLAQRRDATRREEHEVPRLAGAGPRMIKEVNIYTILTFNAFHAAKRLKMTDSQRGPVGWTQPPLRPDA